MAITKKLLVPIATITPVSRAAEAEEDAEENGCGGVTEVPEEVVGTGSLPRCLSEMTRHQCQNTL